MADVETLDQGARLASNLGGAVGGEPTSQPSITPISHLGSASFFSTRKPGRQAG